MAEAEDTLLEALSFSRAYPLNQLHTPHYSRELRTRTHNDMVIMEIDKRGFQRYKRRWPYPQYPPLAIDAKAIQAALNTAFEPRGLYISAINDCGQYIEIEVTTNENARKDKSMG